MESIDFLKKWHENTEKSYTLHEKIKSIVPSEVLERPSGFNDDELKTKIEKHSMEGT